MIKGRKHVWCGRVNWFGQDSCPFCKPWGRVPKEMYQFTDVIFDNPKLETLAAKAQKMADSLRMKIRIDYDSDQDNEAGDVIGAIIIDGWITIYPEKIKRENLNLLTKAPDEIDGWAIDLAIPVHNYPNEPDDVDVNRFGTFEYWTAALSNVFEIIFKENLNNVCEGMMFEEQAEQEKDLPF